MLGFSLTEEKKLPLTNEPTAYNNLETVVRILVEDYAREQVLVQHRDSSALRMAAEWSLEPVGRAL